MRQLSPAAFLVLAAFTIPVAVELRTAAALFGVKLPFVAVVVFEAALLLVLTAVYVLGRVSPDDGGTTTP